MGDPPWCGRDTQIVFAQITQLSRPSLCELNASHTRGQPRAVRPRYVTPPYSPKLFTTCPACRLCRGWDFGSGRVGVTQARGIEDRTEAPVIVGREICSLLPMWPLSYDTEIQYRRGV